MTCRRLAWLAPLLLVGGTAVADGTRLVAEWPQDLGDPWKRRDFVAATQYTAGTTQRPSLAARADASASALYREVEIDLTRTPYLQWSWRVDELPGITAAETEKRGDDYGARVYVVREGFFGKLSANALNYVWSQRQPIDSTWANAYASRAMMWSVESDSSALGQWRSYTRNVRADWRAAFGKDIDMIHGVALMTDADDSASQAAAYYGNIRFCATPDCTPE